jgi:hypothetical protein
MDQNEFEARIRAVATISERPIDGDGVRTRHGAYKDYGGMTVDSLKPCEGDCPDCGRIGECNPRRSHRRVQDGWQSYCSGCARYKNRVTGRYEIKSASGKKTIL